MSDKQEIQSVPEAINEMYNMNTFEETMYYLSARDAAIRADEAGNNTFYKNIAIHFEMMCTDEIRAHAYADETHDLDFQVFRVLGGYRKALEEIDSLRAELDAVKGER